MYKCPSSKGGLSGYDQLVHWEELTKLGQNMKKKYIWDF